MSGQTVRPQTEAMEPGPALTYVCNAGILLSWGGQTAAIDVFAHDPGGIYLDTPPEWKEKIFALASEGKLPLMIISHEHADHYCGEDVLAAVEAAWRNGHPTGILTTGAVAEDLLGRAGQGIRNVIRQNLLVLPEGEQGCSFDLGSRPDGSGLHVKALSVRHDGKQYEGVQNMLLLLQLRAGERTLRIVFPADASPGARLCAQIAGWSQEADWLIAPFPFIGKTSARKALSAALRVRHIAACHFPVPEKDAQDWYARTAAVCAGAQDELPFPVFLREPGRVLSLL